MNEIKNIKPSILKQCKYTLFLRGGEIIPKSYKRMIKKKKLNTVLLNNLDSDCYIDDASELTIHLLKCDFSRGVLAYHEGRYEFINAYGYKAVKKLYRIFKWRKNPIDIAIKCFNKTEYRYSALIQLSDLHFKSIKDDFDGNLDILIKSIQEENDTYDDVHVLVTGDMVDNPNTECAKGFNEFRNTIEGITGNEIYIIPGNHDIDIKGITVNKKKRVAYSEANEYPKIELIPESKIALILFNSNEAGQLLARGLIGEKQLKSASEKFKYFKSTGLNDGYTLIAALHHHLVPYLPEGYKESIIKRIIQNDKTLLLDDADEFIKWLKKHNIHYVLHGHKHIPYVTKKDEINIVSCGSSTMKTPEEPFINYNVILNKENKIMVLECFPKGKKKTIKVFYM